MTAQADPTPSSLDEENGPADDAATPAQEDSPTDDAVAAEDSGAVAEEMDAAIDAGQLDSLADALVEDPQAEAVEESAAVDARDELAADDVEAVEDAAVEDAAAAAVSDDAAAEAPADEVGEAVADEDPADAAAAEVVTSEWGRVDEDGTVSVLEGDAWRVVGQYPDGSQAEALAYFERKFSDLAGEVALLEVRYRRGGASSSDLRGTARALQKKIVGAAAVGDLAGLEARVVALDGALAQATATEAAAAREAVDEAIAARTALVERAEQLAARDPKSVQWKQASAELATLFDEWQSQQQSGPRLPRSAAQQLWKRFRDARAIVDRHRREFYAELDETHKAARDRKASLVDKAEALAPKGEDGIGAYRDLLDQWKNAGRAGKKADDALWARFKAAGDALYAARSVRETAEAEESRERIAAKKELLEEAKAVADEREIAKARALLTGIQRRWDEVGRIFPREAERSLDDDLRKIEQSLRTREDTDWKRNNPEVKARANDMTRQLMEAIEKLEDELAAAERSGDRRAIAKAAEALEARRGWLRAVGG